MHEPTQNQLSNTKSLTEKTFHLSWLPKKKSKRRFWLVTQGIFKGKTEWVSLLLESIITVKNVSLY